MAENKYSCATSAGRDTVCIEANRILDSCRDRDCFEHVRVLLTDCGNDIVEHTSNIRVKSACITWTQIDINPIPFNRGFYTVDIKFYIKLTFEACISPGRIQEFEGIAVLEKKVVLFGGESNVSIFKSSPDNDFCSMPQFCCSMPNTPVAIVEVVDPIVLSTKVLESPGECCCCCCCCDVPEHICGSIDGALCDPGENGRYLAVSIGIFSIIRIVRPAQYLINATEYAVPDKECVAAEESNPCQLFRHMAFPTAEFNPSPYPIAGGNGCCGSEHPTSGDKRGCGCGN
ncbi:MAG: hypothetical protein IJW99_03170 [Clostridia bacterium]|nr:hypothetical protein [Clostridia bacterium]